MGKVVINSCYGGFGISREAYEWLKEHGINEDILSCSTRSDNCNYFGSRHNPILIQCVEELGEKASGIWASLRVVQFKGDLYRIVEYDGLEDIETPDDIIWDNCNDY